MPNDSADTLAARVQKRERELVVETLGRLAAAKVHP
jgi:folate-dependent phosphoribosylglycinamide formyltransferase PurN